MLVCRIPQALCCIPLLPVMSLNSAPQEREFPSTLIEYQLHTASRFTANPLNSLKIYIHWDAR